MAVTYIEARKRSTDFRSTSSVIHRDHGRRIGAIGMAPVLLTALLIVAGCSDKKDNDTNPPAKTDATASETISTVPSTIQEITKKPDSILPSGPQYFVEYKIAADAAWLANNEYKFKQARGKAAGIKDPQIRRAAVHAIDEATAQDAAWTATSQFEFDKAEKELDTIVNPDVREAGEYAVDMAELADVAWNVKNGDMEKAKKSSKFVEDPKLRSQAEYILKPSGQFTDSDSSLSPRSDLGRFETWNYLYKESNQRWVELKRKANEEWHILYERSGQSTISPTPIELSADADSQRVTEAVNTACFGYDFLKADQLVFKIEDPRKREKAKIAIDTSKASQAATAARFGYDNLRAEKLIDTIEDPGLRQQAETTVDLQEASSAIGTARYGFLTTSKFDASMVEDPVIKEEMENGLADPNSARGQAIYLSLDKRAQTATFKLAEQRAHKCINPLQ